jgi:prolyl-tRNA synthetase
MDAAEGQEILMPSLHPKENWETTGRWKSFDALFRLKSRSGSDYALGPTHEEVIYPLLRHYVSSYKDLPVYLYQIQTKFRDEPRAKSGLLRGREFRMKDFYSFHSNDGDRDKYYEVMKKAYLNIFKRIGIDVILTESSGGTFSNHSHEFQVVSEAGEDTIYVCEKCRVAVNEEIIKEQKVCPECGNPSPFADRNSAKGEGLKKVKGIEVGNIFPLKENYARDFHLTFKDKNGEEKLVSAGCYGLGVSRLIGAIVEANNDEKGIIWPEAVAPFKAHLISLGKSDKTKKFADKIYDTLSSFALPKKSFGGSTVAFGEGGQKNGVEVLYDDREEMSAGEKFSDADLIGIPYRLVVSEKTGDKIEVKKRDEGQARLIGEKELISMLIY